MPAAMAVVGVRALLPLAALGFLMDAVAHPLYGLSVAQTNDYVARDEFVPAAGGLLLAYSIGASIGPTAIVAGMAAMGPTACSPLSASAVVAVGLHGLPHDAAAWRNRSPNRASSSR